MKNTSKNKTKAILSLVLSVLLCSVFALLSFSAEDDFEKQIASFPESYKPYLRELHKAHPSWEFEPFFTYLDFNEAVDNECGTKSLVSSSTASDIFKSKDAGYYNYTTGAYIQKDSGFVVANRLAVAYFMDPRNFLNVDGIFQFETLSFNEAFTTSVIETVLKGSFMYKKNITYLDSEGETVTTTTKYSKAIYNAGKKYNINPCFLASKILNEVGTTGSKSVTGNHSTYPGIYNFYNIGATDGSGAIARGLQWASTGTTYHRPWTTPKKSIYGGAQYLAESYIAAGQFTGYLQRFNVNPNGKYSVYTHQYMTNLTGALSQGYSTYASYAGSGLLENKYVFSIPVYENMPSEYSTNGDGRFLDSANQTGKISASSSYVRTGPSTSYAKRLTSAGAEIKLTSGTAVTILGKVNTDAKYYMSVLQYPYWYKISFTYGGTTYQGYVPEGFVNISTEISVGVGDYTPAVNVTDSSINMEFISYDCNIAKVNANNTISFLKSGTVYIAAYDSIGNFDKVKFVVGTAVATPTVSVSGVSANKAVVSFGSVASAKGYEIVAADSSGNIIKTATVTASPYTVTGLKGSGRYTIGVRAVLDNSATKKYGAFAFTEINTPPDFPTVTNVTRDSSGNVTVYWNKLSGVSGYCAYTYNPTTKVYTKIGDIPATDSSYVIPAGQIYRNCFSIRAYEVLGQQTLYGGYSAVFDLRNIPASCTGAAVSSVTDSGYTLTWNGINGAGYRIYKENNGVFGLFKSVDKPTYTVKNAGLSAYAKYKVAAYKTVSGIVFEGASTSEFTATTTPAAVTGLKVSVTPNGGKFTWKAVDNATCYVVYIYKESKGKYVKKTTVKTNSYEMTDKSPGKTYDIRIRACIKTTFKNYYGEYDTISFYTTPEKVTDVKVSSVKKDSLKLSWEKTGGTSRYYIYQYNPAKKKYVRMLETKSLSYSATGLEAGTTYKFRIKSVKIVNGKVVSSITSSTVTTTTKPDTVSKISAKRSKTSLRLLWPEVEGATNYQIYMYNTEKGKYVRLTTVEGVTEYKIKDLEPGQTYKFRIRPFKSLNGKNYFASYSAIYSFTTKS